MKSGEYVLVGKVNEYKVTSTKNPKIQAGQVVKINNPKHKYYGKLAVVDFFRFKMIPVSLIGTWEPLKQRLAKGSSGLNGSSVEFSIRKESLTLLPFKLANYSANHYMTETRCVMSLPSYSNRRRRRENLQKYAQDLESEAQKKCWRKKRK